jgi:glycosyltransferase involved in cell wall biosynthesis
MLDVHTPEHRPAVLPLSIIVSTINPQRCCNLIASLLKFAEHMHIIIIVDGREYDTYPPLHAYARSADVLLKVLPANRGLSYCRNLGMSLSRHRHVLFFDDDVVLPTDVLAGYRRLFQQGFAIVGGPLTLPDTYPSVPGWLPAGLSSLLGIHTIEEKIWGANFGFDLMHCTGRAITFREELGRRRSQLQCGEDTTFVSEFVRTGAPSAFDRSIAVEHHVDIGRFRLSYLVRRSFWQGRSEIRRSSPWSGVKKEWRRAMSGGPVGIWLKVIRSMAGVGLFACFLAGLIYEAIVRPISVRSAKLEVLQSPKHR